MGKNDPGGLKAVRFVSLSFVDWFSFLSFLLLPFLNLD